MQKSIFKKLFSDQRGATVMIAMGISIMIIGFSFAIATISRDTGRDIIAFKDSSQSKLLAESTNEELLLATKEKEAGFNARGEICTNLLGTSTRNGTIYCNILGRSETTLKNGPDEWYSVPAPGTGDAAFGRGCSQDGGDGGIDDSCHWGKIEFGNSLNSRVVIPLFFEFDSSDDAITLCPGDDGDKICNPSESELNNLYLRLRTPCLPVDGKEVVNCENSGRYKIATDDDVYSKYTENKTILNWEIQAEECQINKQCALVPLKGIDKDSGIRIGGKNFEIHELLVRDLMDIPLFSLKYNVLQGKDYKGEVLNSDLDDKSIIDFLKDGNVKKPKLSLSLAIQSIFEEETATTRVKIPFLEYQLLTDKPVSNNYQRYSIQVEYNDQTFKLDSEVEQSKDVIDFAIQN